MDQTPFLDLSSDDEVGFDNSSTADNFDWISKFLEDIGGEDDGNNGDSGRGDDDDDSDDVVVVGEVLARKPKRSKTKTTICRYDDRDDDCVVLDCDPHKPTTEMKDSEEDSDDLLIIGEKGQVACRDYPHARHLCAQFPFSSTPHESRCDLCHCYVCDSLAPCTYWGSGISSIDHCHATDKKEYWRLERKKFRELKNSPVPIVKSDAPSLPQLSRFQQISGQPDPLSRPAATCGVSSSYGLPNIIRQGRSQTSSIVAARNQFQPRLVSRQLRSCNNYTQGQINRSASLAARMVSSRSMFKRSGLTSRSYGPLNNVNIPYLQLPNHQLAGKPIENNSTNLAVPSHHLDINPSSCQPNTSSISLGILPSQLQGCSQPSPHTPTSHFQGCGQSAAVTTDSPYVYSSVNQTQNACIPILPFSTSNELNSIMPTSQQHSAMTVANSMNQRSHQASVVETQDYPSPIFSCNTLDTPNSVAQSCLGPSVEVQGAVPMHELLPSIEQNPQPRGSADSSAVDFDLDKWLRDSESILGQQEESLLFGMNSHQPSVPAPVDAGMPYFDFETSWQGLAHSWP